MSAYALSVVLAAGFVVFAPLVSSACPLAGDVVQAHLKRVVDGDTIWLTDGRKVRLIGINSPEVGRNTTPSQPYAASAKAFLSELLLRGDGVLLRLGSQTHDRYGRLLAHVFTQDRRNVQALLLDKGFAAHIVIPPNLWQSECYARLEHRARQQVLNMWSHARFRPLPATQLSAKDTGFYLVSGQVGNIKRKRGHVYVEMPGRLTLKIAIDHWDMLRDHLQAASSARRTVVVKGWISQYKNKSWMHIKHPMAIVQ